MNDERDESYSLPQPEAPVRVSKLRGMASLDNVAYLAFDAVAFTLGIVTPLFAPTEKDGAHNPLFDTLGNNPLALAGVLVLVAGASAATGFVMARFVRRYSLIHRVMVKWLMLFLPPFAAGQVAAMALGTLGAYELSSRDFAFLAFGATSYAFVAIAGIAALRLSPEYWSR